MRGFLSYSLWGTDSCISWFCYTLNPQCSFWLRKGRKASNPKRILPTVARLCYRKQSFYFQKQLGAIVSQDSSNFGESLSVLQRAWARVSSGLPSQCSPTRVWHPTLTGSGAPGGPHHTVALPPDRNRNITQPLLDPWFLNEQSVTVA